MKYLSIYENDWDVREFLFQNGFITEEEKNDDEYDLLKWFEGDPDWVDVKQPGGYYDRIYFATFNPCYKHEGDSVCLHTGDSASDAESIQQYLENPKTFTGYEPNRWEEMEKDKQHDFKVAFRGGMGYVYSLAFA